MEKRVAERDIPLPRSAECSYHTPRMRAPRKVARIRDIRRWDFTDPATPTVPRGTTDNGRPDGGSTGDSPL